MSTITSSKLVQCNCGNVEIMKKSLYVELYIPHIPFLNFCLFALISALFFSSLGKIQETCR